MKRLVVLCMLLALPFVSASLFDADGVQNAHPEDAQYEEIVDALFAGDAVEIIDGKLWVPWYSSSTSCSVNDLQRGNNCNIGTVDMQHNCMVSDELSQVSILVAMGKDQARMDAFVNTLHAINTSYGSLPSWRVVRNGMGIEPCRAGVNGNCDTASDATARFIIALAIARENPAFSQESRAAYAAFSQELAADFYTYEIVHECHDGICNWLASGSSSAKGGVSSTDFGYTGYYADAIIAMLYMCRTNETYCGVAKDFTQNYLRAASWNGKTFSVPPGRSFRWDMSGTPAASCTNTCTPDMWDDADAPRALLMCNALYYSKKMDLDLGIAEYCALWSKDMRDPRKAPLQYNADGSIVKYQSGVFSQGLQALFLTGARPELFQATLQNALDHYSPQTKTFDYAGCFGVYKNSLAVRALGIGLERDGFNPVVPSVPAAATKVSIVPAGLSVSTVQVNGLTYQLSCDVRGMTPVSYSWRIHETPVLTQTGKLLHTFPASGTYKIRCIARDDASTWSTLTTVTV